MARTRSLSLKSARKNYLDSLEDAFNGPLGTKAQLADRVI